MDIKDLKRMLYNRKRMQKHVEKFTNDTNNVDGDLTKFHTDILESLVEHYEINAPTTDIKPKDIKDLKEFDDALEELFNTLEKGEK